MSGGAGGSLAASGAPTLGSPTLHVLRFRLLGGLRGLIRDAFAVLLLGSIVVGAAVWIVSRYLEVLRTTIALHAVGEVGALPGPASLVVVLLATAFLAPAVRRELYALAPAPRLAEPLPLAPAARFRVALGLTLVASLPLVAGGLVVAGFLAEGAVGALGWATWTLRLLAAAATLVPLAVVVVLVLVRARLRGAALAGVGVALPALAVAGAAAGHPLGEALLLPWWAAAAQLEAVAASALGLPLPGRAAAAPWFLLVELALGATLARVLYLRWRSGDLETAGHLTRGGSVVRRRISDLLLAPGRRRLGGAVAVQVGRDLLLVLRRFSPAVHLAAAGTILLWMAAVAALPEGVAWGEPLGVFLAILAVYPPAALVPFLLRHQLASGWLERSSGVDPETVWKAKLWSARLLALPALAGSAAVVAWLATRPGRVDPLELGVVGVLLQLLAGGWIVASFLGVAVFETAEHPFLGLLFASLAGLALAALLVFVPRVAWMWVVLYVFGQGAVASRATRRVELLGTGI